jgi:hypothetical protein
MARKPRTRKQPVCFFSIPKCATSSIGKILLEWDNTWNLFGNYDRFSGEHLDDEAVTRLWANGWWFTFVRNPWARVISAWQMFEQNPKFAAPEVGGRRRTLDEVLRLADVDWKTYVNPYHAQRRPQELRGADEHLQIHLAPCWTAPLEKMQFIGQVESIAADWETVQDCTGIRVAMGRHNTTQHKHHREYYNREQRELVRRIYQEDADKFAYSF